MIRLPRFYIAPRRGYIAPVVLAALLVFTPVSVGAPQLAPAAPSSQSEEERGGEDVVAVRPARSHAHTVSPPAAITIPTRGAINRRPHFDRSAHTGRPARGPDGPYLRC